MYTLKLTYFDFDGGRAEPARLAMHIGGIPFEDFRFSYDQFEEVRKSTPFGQVPTLEVDGKLITQSNAINRFVGKLAGLYPSDPLQALLCDEVMDAVEDVSVKLSPTFRMQGEEQKRAREALVAEVFPKYLKWAGARLAEQGGEYFADNRLTIADLKIFGLVRWLNSGVRDHVPATLVEAHAPNLNKHSERVANIPAIVEYYSSRSQHK
jgi:glutathione S-transferase